MTSPVIRTAGKPRSSGQSPGSGSTVTTRHRPGSGSRAGGEVLGAQQQERGALPQQGRRGLTAQSVGHPRLTRAGRRAARPGPGPSWPRRPRGAGRRRPPARTPAAPRCPRRRPACPRRRGPRPRGGHPPRRPAVPEGVRRERRPLRRIRWVPGRRGRGGGRRGSATPRPVSAARTARFRASAISPGPDTYWQQTETSARWRMARPPLPRGSGPSPTTASTGARSAAAFTVRPACAARRRRAGRRSSRGGR